MWFFLEPINNCLAHHIFLIIFLEHLPKKKTICVQLFKNHLLILTVVARKTILTSYFDNNVSHFMNHTYSMSLVILVLGIILEDFGVDDELGSGILDAELDDDCENVRLRSIPLRTMSNKSSKNFFDEVSVRPVLS
jgi:hypothetical protein